MYPLAENQTYPLNQWYIGAWSHEVSRTLTDRTILGEPVVFYRTEAGEPVAMAGLCPHRLYPLVKGTLVGDAVECGYHGLTFDCSGKCTRIPSQDGVPSRFATKTFPVVERWQWIWIWMGDPALADPAKIPDTGRLGLGTEGWRADPTGTTHLNGRYQLLIDNLMDLSHISYTHAVSLPGGSFIASIPAVLEEDGAALTVTRTFPPNPIDPFGQFLLPHVSGIVHNKLVSEYLGPCLINAAGPYITKVGEEHTYKVNFIHGCTPETPTSTHYFTAVSRNFRTDDEALSGMLIAQMRQVLAEDIEPINLIEPNIERHADVKRELSVPADAGAIRVRRRLSDQIKAEQLGAVAVSAVNR
ncbi:MAG: aromatic ring-hydroxylating dioxygenase subunit alpha [Pseudomonadota bacterium]